MDVSPEAASRREQTLSHAIAQIAERWGLSDAELSAVLGLSQDFVAKLRTGNAELNRAAQSFEAAQLLLRLFMSLDAMLGSDDASARSWLSSHNIELGSAPIDHIDTLQGLIEVCEYVDAYRLRS